MPQPIDMQSELGRVTMAERVQDAAARASLIAAQRGQIEEEDERAVRETQVDETPETQNEHVDEDGRRKNPYVGKRGKGAKDQAATDSPPGASAKKSSSAEDGDHNFDVSV